MRVVILVLEVRCVGWCGEDRRAAPSLCPVSTLRLSTLVCTAAAHAISSCASPVRRTLTRTHSHSNAAATTCAPCLDLVNLLTVRQLLICLQAPATPGPPSTLITTTSSLLCGTSLPPLLCVRSLLYIPCPSPLSSMTSTSVKVGGIAGAALVGAVFGVYLQVSPHSRNLSADN